MDVKLLKRRVLGGSLALVMAVSSFFSTKMIVNAYTDAQEEMRKNLYNATKEIEKVFIGEYETARQQLVTKVRDEELDETLSLMSFDNQKNPLIGTNYIEIIALYSAIKKHCQLKGKDIKTGFAGIPFITMDLKEESVTEDIPALIPKYETGEDGYFHKVGNEIIKEETVVPVYTEVEGQKGCYEITGTTTVAPEEKTTSYLETTLVKASFDTITEYFGLTFDAIEDRYKEYYDAIDSILNPATLTQNTFIELRRSFDFISEMSIEELNSYIKNMTEEQRKIILLAKMFIGQIPYQWGGKAEMGGYNNAWWTYDENGEQRGLDCSGFVQWIYMTAGYSPDITSKLVSTSCMVDNLYDISEDQLQPGDIGLLYNGQGEGINHCGIYVGAGYYIHCSSGKGTVTLSKFPFKYYKSITPRVYFSIDNNSEEDYYDNDYYTISEEETAEPISEEELVAEEQSIASEYISDINLSPEDNSSIYLLAQLMTHEALNQGYNGWVAAGEVVRNRVLSALFPSTYEEVIYQDGQFTGRSELKTITPSEEMLSIAKDVFLGRVSILNNSDVLYFRNPMITSNIPAAAHVDWGEHAWFTAVNEHAFYLQ
ncbi:MAG: C40 family peptidase [Butyrivibrio sp.]|uniref:NlpC/P60 family protein n=1 Tax=Butyrivibrio sp. TaxID=28121 RepID=UPI001B5D3D2C|nr:NlpC/P60 family protein [Butyrivibrio sp.]MBP3784474.1 C40 family peptidase [Butyrivibrio sp.]